MSRILVTGANGFIGRGLLPRLAADGHSIRAAVRTRGDLPGEVSIVGDIGLQTEWGRALEGIETVIHLAGRAHIGPEPHDAAVAAFRRVNVDGTMRLARQAEAAGVTRFVFLSSVKAAAETSSGRMLTEADPPHPRTPYGMSKWEAEQALRGAVYGMATVILRPPLVYGPGVRANFRALLRLVALGVPLPFASIHNRRSLIALENLVDAIAIASKSPEAAGGTFYVTDGDALSTPALITALATALCRPARLIPVPVGLIRNTARLFGASDAAGSLIGSLEVDDAAFRAATGWRPPVLQIDAFRSVAAWYSADRSSGRA